MSRSEQRIRDGWAELRRRAAERSAARRAAGEGVDIGEGLQELFERACHAHRLHQWHDQVPQGVSPGQGRMLLLLADGDLTVSELAVGLAVSRQVVWRSVVRLEGAGLVRRYTRGNRRFVGLTRFARLGKQLHADLWHGGEARLRAGLDDAAFAIVRAWLRGLAEPSKPRVAEQRGENIVPSSGQAVRTEGGTHARRER